MCEDKRGGRRMTPEEIAIIRRNHVREGNGSGSPYCEDCGESWPCDPNKLTDALDVANERAERYLRDLGLAHQYKVLLEANITTAKALVAELAATYVSERDQHQITAKGAGEIHREMLQFQLQRDEARERIEELEAEKARLVSSWDAVKHWAETWEMFPHTALEGLAMRMTELEARNIELEAEKAAHVCGFRVTQTVRTPW